MGTITKPVLQELEKVLESLRPNINASLTYLRRRIDVAYAALQGEADKSVETLKGAIANANGDLTKISNTEIPLTASMVDTATTYLVSTFLSGYPIFAVTAEVDKEDAATQLTVLTERDQVRFNWSSELSQFLEDCVAYPLGAVEVIWKEKRGNAAAVRTIDDKTVPVATPVVYTGNAIRRLDPYNTFGDFSVAPSKVHEEGTYSGYVEELNYIQMKRRIYDWDEAFFYADNISNIFKYTGVNNTFYKYHEGTNKTSEYKGTNGIDWSVIWAAARKPGTDVRPEKYEVVTIYYRLCPEDFGATKNMLQNPGAPAVFQLIWVNGKLCVAKPIVSGHEYLPIIMAKYQHSKLETKTLTEKEIPFQYVSTALMNGSLASVRKAVAGGDRYYNARYVSADILNAYSDKGKNIPINLPALSNNISIDQVIKQVPYVDTVSQTVLPLMNAFINLSEKLQGINPATQGNFVKGNRTRQEFDTTQNNSQSRLAKGAMLLESTAFAPIKEIIKLNYLIYAPPEAAAKSPNAETSVAIDPQTLRESAPEYQFGDGFLPSTKIQNTEVALQAVQFLSQFPEKAAEYDLGGIMVSILKQNGFTGLNRYKRSPEDAQKYLEQQAQYNAAKSGTTPPTA